MRHPHGRTTVVTGALSADRPAYPIVAAGALPADQLGHEADRFCLHGGGALGSNAVGLARIALMLRAIRGQSARGYDDGAIRGQSTRRDDDAAMAGRVDCANVVMSLLTPDA